MNCRREEVAGHDARGLGAQDVRPARTRPSRRGSETRAAQDVADRHRRDLVAELLELSLDAPVAPARVVLGETDDQVFEIPRDRGSAATPAPPPRRFAGDEAAVPTQQGLGTHCEDLPPGSGEQPAGGGEQEAAWVSKRARPTWRLRTSSWWPKTITSGAWAFRERWLQTMSRRTERTTRQRRE